jgi:hypothetical protein
LSILKILILSGFITVAAPRSASGQSKRGLTIRVLNAKSGKPLTNVRVWMDWLDGSILPIQKINDDGVATFRLPGALPRTRGPFVNSFNLDIRSGDFHPIDQILKAGEVSDNDCGKAKYDLAAEPGEQVIFAKHPNVFQRIYQLYY